MTKSSKLIATLGVVAGLGVAALPLGSVFATQTSQSATGNVQVDVEVQPAIAMTIVGNNDDHSKYNDGTHTYASVDSFNPASIASPAEGQKNSLDSHEIPTTAVTGLSSSYTVLTPNTAVDGMTATEGNPGYGFKSTINIYTNSASGYTLSVADDDSTTALTRDNTDGKGAATIAAGTSIQAGTANWAYKVAASAAEAPDAAGTVETGKDSWTAITQAGAQIAHEDVKTSGGTEYVVGYGVSTGVDQMTGVYSDTIIYTATTK